MSLKALREKINTIDESIIKLLAERQEISKDIGRLKVEMGVDIVDPERELALLEFHRRLGVTYALSTEFIGHIFNIIIMESRTLQL
jgi:chorismate mutase